MMKIKNRIHSLVTIIIPSRAVDDLLLKCLTVIHDIYPLVRVIVVIDNMFDTRASEIHEEWNIFVIESINRNISAKRNLGCAFASTKYIAFIDSDAYPDYGWLENAVAFLDTHPEYGLATGIQKPFPTDSKMSQAIRSLRTSPLFTSPGLLKLYDIKRKDEVDTLTMCSANAVLNREKYLSVGGMNGLIYIGEDQELAHRFVKRGIKMRFIPSVSIFHKERGLGAFLRQRYTFAYSFPINLLKSANIGYILLGMGPAWGLLFIIFSLLAAYYFGLDWKIILLLPASAILVLVLESLRIARTFREAGRVFFAFLCVYFVWTVSIFFGIFRLPPKPRTVYKHE